MRTLHGETSAPSYHILGAECPCPARCRPRTANRLPPHPRQPGCVADCARWIGARTMLHATPCAMATPRATEGIKVISENRRARMRYSFDEFLEVGVSLVGSEVKSLRAGKIELADAYAHVV